MASILDSIFSRANPVPRSGLGYGILAPGATLPQQTAQPLAPATPVTPRDKVIQAARQAGTFDAQRQKYNQEALAMGSMTEMDEAGNIVQREPSEYEAYLNAGRLTGGNTSMPTSNPLQRAMQMEAQRQITNENARNAVQAEKMMAEQRAQERADAEKARRYEAGVRTVAPGVETLFGKYGRGFVAPAGTVPSNMQAVLQKAREEEAMGNVSDADLALMAAGKMAPPISSETVVPAMDFNKSLASAMTKAWEIERNKKMAEAAKKDGAKPVAAAAKAETKADTGKPVAKTAVAPAVAMTGSGLFSQMQGLVEQERRKKLIAPAEQASRERGELLKAAQIILSGGKPESGSAAAKLFEAGGIGGIMSRIAELEKTYMQSREAADPWLASNFASMEELRRATGQPSVMGPMPENLRMMIYGF